MEFLSKKTAIDSSEYESLIHRFTADKAFVEFVIKNNVAHFKESGYILVEGVPYSFEYFLGRSKKTSEDLIGVFGAYDGRIPAEHLAIAVVNEVDFICVGPASRFYIWRRDVNDLYFDQRRPDTYKKQDKKLSLLTQDFNALLDLMREGSLPSESADEFEDDYENPNTPFDDEDLIDDFTHPELFFKQSADAIQIQLKKLSLSSKGRELLAVFRDRGLV